MRVDHWQPDATEGLDSWPATLIAGVHEAPVTDWIRQHVSLSCGAQHWTPDAVELAASVKLDVAGLEDLCSEPEAVDLREARRARLRMGHLRYGDRGRNTYDAIGSSVKRWQEYMSGGNREHLVDICNLIAIEWLWPNTPPGAVQPWPFWRQPTSYERYPVHVYLSLYNEGGNRAWLVLALDAVRREWLEPTVAGAHWAAQDCGGHWSLRND